MDKAHLNRFTAAALSIVMSLQFSLLLGWFVLAFYRQIDAGGQSLRGFLMLFGFRSLDVVPFAMIALLLPGPAIHFSLRFRHQNRGEALPPPLQSGSLSYSVRWDIWFITRVIIYIGPFIRVGPNQAMEPTTGRRTPKFSMTPTSHPAATRALARGGSSCSR
jgi:hypothetical protein